AVDGTPDIVGNLPDSALQFGALLGACHRKKSSFNSFDWTQAQGVKLVQSSIVTSTVSFYNVALSLWLVSEFSINHSNKVIKTD
ncbi:MAG TPA: hypothetical protein PK565_11615, partial [Nitrosomonas sp.]|nr:hypothetical protein [Nitrosomonas sp.]